MWTCTCGYDEGSSGKHFVVKPQSVLTSIGKKVSEWEKTSARHADHQKEVSRCHTEVMIVKNPLHA